MHSPHHPPTAPAASGLYRQQGVTLIELMVGLLIGLMVVGVAMAALMVSRGISGTVSDASNIQQQAAYALRVMGLQLRQAGSLRLDDNPGGATAEAYMAPVVFETMAPAAGGNDFNPSEHTISGADTSLSTGFRRYKDRVYGATNPETLLRNCLGGPADGSTDERFENNFSFNATKYQLECGGNGALAQPIVRNVANFQVRYLAQQGSDQIQYVKASDIGTSNPIQWRNIQAVEVCLVLFGDESMDMPTGSSYLDCPDPATGASATVDMTTLTGNRAKRMHRVFRNVFQLRSQGLVS